MRSSPSTTPHSRSRARTDVTPFGEATALAFKFARAVSRLNTDERTAAHSLLAELLWRPAPQDPMP